MPHVITEERLSSWKCQGSEGALPGRPPGASGDVSSGEDELIGGDPLQWKCPPSLRRGRQLPGTARGVKPGPRLSLDVLQLSDMCRVTSMERPFCSCLCGDSGSGDGGWTCAREGGCEKQAAWGSMMCPTQSVSRLASFFLLQHQPFSIFFIPQITLLCGKVCF